MIKVMNVTIELDPIDVAALSYFYGDANLEPDETEVTNCLTDWLGNCLWELIEDYKEELGIAPEPDEDEEEHKKNIRITRRK